VEGRLEKLCFSRGAPPGFATRSIANLKPESLEPGRIVPANGTETAAATARVESEGTQPPRGMDRGVRTLGKVLMHERALKRRYAGRHSRDINLFLRRR
jgi:hypothetical protein